MSESESFATLPPQNLEAEESVLGAMMLSPGACGVVSEILSRRRLLPDEPRDDLPGGAPPSRRPASPSTRSRSYDELQKRGDVDGEQISEDAGCTNSRRSYRRSRTPSTTPASFTTWRRSAA
jgi:hypothetical protein